MAIQLNHTIVWCRDQKRSASFLSDILGLPPPSQFSHFDVVTLDNNLSLDFAETGDDITPQHYAFLIGEAEFDEIHGRILERSRDFWADPMLQRAGEINRRDGGRGLYFLDPDGHVLEIITRPYGGGGS